MIVATRAPDPALPCYIQWCQGRGSSKMRTSTMKPFGATSAGTTPAWKRICTVWTVRATFAGRALVAGTTRVDAMRCTRWRRS